MNLDEIGSTVRGDAGQVLGGTSPTAALKVLPDLARVAAGVCWRTGRWTLDASLHLGGTVIRGAASGRSPQSLVDEVAAEAKRYLREFLGVTDADPMPEALRRRIPRWTCARSDRSASAAPWSGRGSR